MKYGVVGGQRDFGLYPAKVVCKISTVDPWKGRRSCHSSSTKARPPFQSDVISFRKVDPISLPDVSLPFHAFLPSIPPASTRGFPVY